MERKTTIVVILRIIFTELFLFFALPFFHDRANFIPLKLHFCDGTPQGLRLDKSTLIEWHHAINVRKLVENAHNLKKKLKIL